MTGILDPAHLDELARVFARAAVDRVLAAAAAELGRSTYCNGADAFRPADRVELAAAVRRLARSGLTDRDIADTMRLPVAEVATLIREGGQ